MDVPEGWRASTIGDLCAFVTSGSRGWAQYYSESGAAFIRIANLRRDMPRLEKSDIVRVFLPENLAEGRRTQLQCGDILVSITADLGIVALVDEDVGEAYINQHIALIRLSDPNVADPGFVAAYLCGGDAQREFGRNNDAGAKAGLNLSTIRRIPVILPPPPEQRKIAAILSSVDEAIEKTQAVIDQVQVVKKGLMQELLTKGLPGRHEKFKQTEIGTIPESWKIGTVADVVAACDYGLNAKLTSDPSGIPVLRMGNVQDGRILMQGMKYLADQDFDRPDLVLEPGDILFNRTNSIDLVGKVGIFEAAQRASFASYLLRLRVREGVEPRWLNYVLNEGNRQAELRASATPGVSQANINRTKLLNLVIPIPSEHEQEQISVILSGIDARINGEKEKLDQLRTLKPALMQSLLTGQIRVTP